MASSRGNLYLIVNKRKTYSLQQDTLIYIYFKLQFSRSLKYLNTLIDIDLNLLFVLSLKGGVTFKGMS